MTTPMTPTEHLDALASSLNTLTAERDAAYADVATARAEATSAQADVARLTSELTAARLAGTAGIDVSALTADLNAAQVAAARAEATADAQNVRLNNLNDALRIADESLEASRAAVEAERVRREAAEGRIADERVSAAQADGNARVREEALRGDNRLIEEQSRHRWPWWAVLLACLIAGILGYLVHALCVPCNKVQVVPPTPVVETTKVDPVVLPEPAPVPTPSGRTISIGIAPVGNPGCCGQ